LFELRHRFGDADDDLKVFPLKNRYFMSPWFTSYALFS